MTRMLLAAAAASIAAFGVGAAPAQAQLITGFYGAPDGGSNFTRAASNDGRFDRRGLHDCFSNDRRFHDGRSGDGRDGHDRMHGHRGSRCNTDVVMDWYGGEWALYNNRSWESDSYNDWWHDRPDRAYPAWMRRNQDCQRPWFAGNTLTC